MGSGILPPGSSSPCFGGRCTSWANSKPPGLGAGAAGFGRESDGSTAASQYARLGIALRAANMERVGGWAEILHRLGDVEAGVAPRLFIHQRGARLIECLPSLEHDQIGRASC